jgi:hypothetical protein
MNRLLLFILSFVPLFLGNTNVKILAAPLLAIFTAIGIMELYGRRNIFFIASPNGLFFLYTTLSLTFGAWGHANEFVTVSSNLADYKSWQFMHVGLTILMLSLSIVVAVDARAQPNYEELLVPHIFKPTIPPLVASLALVPFFFIPLDLQVLGGDGDLSIIPKSVFAMAFMLYAAQFSLIKRGLSYVALILLFASFSIQDKREAIFFIFPITYFELLRYPQRFTLRLFLLIFFVTIFLLFLIIIMSVARGYGGFGEFDSLASALPLVTAYMYSDTFISGLLANIEVNYFFFHALNAIELVMNDANLISFGSTIIKPIFIFLPRDIAQWKPDSIISLYTSVHDPNIRSIGGSWPISLLSEFFWNFYFFAPILTFIFAVIMSKLQIALLTAFKRDKLFKLSFLLFVYMHIITLARGSGIDQFLVYLVLGGLFYGVIWIITSCLHEFSRRKRSEICVEY